MDRQTFFPALRRRLGELGVSEENTNKYIRQFERYFATMTEEEADAQIKSFDGVNGIAQNIVRLIRKKENAAASSPKGEDGAPTAVYKRPGGIKAEAKPDGKMPKLVPVGDIRDDVKEDGSDSKNDETKTAGDNAEEKIGGNTDGNIDGSTGDNADENAVYDDNTAGSESAPTVEAVEIDYENAGSSDENDENAVDDESDAGSEDVGENDGKIENTDENDDAGAETESDGEGFEDDYDDSDVSLYGGVAEIPEGRAISKEGSRRKRLPVPSDNVADEERFAETERSNEAPRRHNNSSGDGYNGDNVNFNELDEDYEEDYPIPNTALYWGIVIASSPVTIPLLAAMFVLFGVLFAVMAVMIVAMIVALIAVIIAGTAVSLIGIIYGVTQLFTTLPVGLFELGLGVTVGGAAMLVGILIYNFAVRLLPFAMKYLGVFLGFTLRKIKGLYRLLKRECAKQK